MPILQPTLPGGLIGGPDDGILYVSPTTSTTYTFEQTSTTFTPVLSNSMRLFNTGNISAIVSNQSSPSNLTVTLPSATLSPFNDSIIVQSALYIFPQSNNYLQFSFNTSSLPTGTYYYTFGTPIYNITFASRGQPDDDLGITTSWYPGGLYTFSHTSPHTCTIQFSNSNVYLFVDGTQAGPSRSITDYSLAPQPVRFSVTNATAYPITSYPLVLYDINILTPAITSIPTLQYTLSSQSLLPYLTLTPTETSVSFVTPLAALPPLSDPNSPLVVITALYNGDVQGTTSYTVEPSGDPPPTTLTVTPAFPIAAPFVETNAFSYTFTSTDYYPSYSTTPVYINYGDTKVTVSNDIITIPNDFTQIVLRSDRLYNTSSLFQNNTTQISIQLPDLTSGIDNGIIGFGGSLTARLTSNTLSVTAPAFTSSTLLTGPSFSNTVVLTDPSWIVGGEFPPFYFQWPISGSSFTITNKTISNVDLVYIIISFSTTTGLPPIILGNQPTYTPPLATLTPGQSYSVPQRANASSVYSIDFGVVFSGTPPEFAGVLTVANVPLYSGGAVYMQYPEGGTDPRMMCAISVTGATAITSIPASGSTLTFTNTSGGMVVLSNVTYSNASTNTISYLKGSGTGTSNFSNGSNFSFVFPSMSSNDSIIFNSVSDVLVLSNISNTTAWQITSGSFLDIQWSLDTTTPAHTYTVGYSPGDYYNFAVTSPSQYTGYVQDNLLGVFNNISNVTFEMELYCYNGFTGPQTSVGIYGLGPNLQFTTAQPIQLALDQTDSTGGTVLLNEYASGVGTNTLKIASSNGFSNTISNAVWRVIGAYGGSNVVQVQSYFTIIPQYVGSTPSFPTPFSTLIYTPYSYTFTLPITTPYTMITSNSDSNVRPLLVNNTSNVVFASTTGFTSPLAYGYLEIDGQVEGNTVASLSSYISVSSNVITQSPTFTGSFTFYKYEPFGPITFTLDSNVVGLTLQYTLSDPPIRSSCTLSPDKQTLTFAGSYNTSYASTLNMFVHAVDSGGIVRSTIRNFVTINPSRFFPPTSNQAFIFYMNEAISVTYGSNLPFQTTVSLDSIPTCTPSLPAGLSFASVSQSTSNFVLQGTPTSQSPSNQYLVVGSNTSTNRVVTVPISIYVKPSRIVVSPSSLTLSTLAVGVPITPVTFTAIQPVSLTSAFKYYWDIPPDGLVFQDLNGNTLVQPFTPTDSSLSIVLAGTPTSNAAYSFMNTSTLYAFHYEPPGIEVEQLTTITYGFVTSVLFTPVTLPNIYATETLPTNSIVISAATYFPSGSPILSITALSLPDGMTLTFSPPNRVYLNGTPTTVSSGTYTFTAVNTLGITGTLNLAIPILQNVVTFTSSTPANATFIVSRPLTAPLSTYYTYPITFTATSAISTQSITYSTSFDITPYGLALVTSNGSATLTGTPTGPLPTTTLNIIASDVLGTTASVPIQLTILADAYSFNTPTLSFVQHVDITPVQITASTLSGRQILYYSSSNLPSGLSLSRLGVLTGTPANSNSGTFTVVASTGYPPAVTSPPFSYTVTPDNVLILMTTNPLALSSTTFSVDAFRAVTYSGYTGTLSIDDATVPSDTTLSISGTVLSGTLPSYPTSFVFTVDATYLNTTSTLPVTLYFNGGVGSISTPVSAGSLVFVTPTQPVFLLYQHCPIQPIVFHVTGNTGFVYYYTVEVNLPIGLSFDTSTATISGTPAVYSDMLSSITVYAVNNGNVTFKTIQMRVITPFFVNPQETGASAYTVLLRNQVTVNGAQNSRDGVVYPTADMSLGSLQSPGAANVNTPDVPCCKK